MSKNIFLGIGAIVLIGLFVLAYQLTSPVTSAPTTGVPTVSSTASVPTSVGQSTTVPVGEAASSGTILSVGAVQAVDFIKDPATIKDPINPGYYYLGYHTSAGVPDPTATNTPPYIIEYISATHYFNIALLQEPIGPVREGAQQYLMAHLGLAGDQLCQLDYMVSVPDRVNSQFSGRNLGFSFCPGATILPK